jgi:hypothetical protein
MARKERVERRIVVSLNRLVNDEKAELAKTRRRRSRCYLIGFVLVALSIGISIETLWPCWVTSGFAALGGLGVGLGVLYDNSINQWPILKRFIDHEALAAAVSAYNT